MNTLYFAIFAYGVMALMLLRALAHHTVFISRAHRWCSLHMDTLVMRIQALSHCASSDWSRQLHTNWPDHPSTRIVAWAIEKPHRLTQHDLLREQLLRDVGTALDDLATESRRNATIAPYVGLMFTVSGLMLFSLISKDDLTAELMLHTMGPALGTTALGGLITIVEKKLFDGRLAGLQRRFQRDGLRLLHTLHDTVLERSWMLRCSPRHIAKEVNDVPV